MDVVRGHEEDVEVVVRRIHHKLLSHLSLFLNTGDIMALCEHCTSVAL